MSDALDEIFEQTKIRVDKRTRRGNLGWAIPPNIERASASHEKKKTQARQPVTAAEKTPKNNCPLPQPSAAVARMISSYDDLVSAFRERVDGLNISRRELDHLAGIAAGHSGKLLGERQVKRFGAVTLGPVLGALGLKLILIEDPEQTVKIRKRAEQRDSRQVRYKLQTEG